MTKRTRMTWKAFCNFYDRLSAYRAESRMFAEGLGYPLGPMAIPDQDRESFLVLWSEVRHPMSIYHEPNPVE